LKLFKIKRIAEFNIFELQFFKTINIYLVFFVLFLKLVYKKVSLVLYTEIELINSKFKYEIKKILNYKYIKSKLKYLIK
jgi:hypothetical protein